MGRPTRPGIGGAIHDALDAIRTTFGPGASDAASPGEGKGGAERSQAIDDAVSQAAGNGDPSQVASNAGRQAQSTDHQNQY